ncbi:hypothetical protein [Desulfosporosinus fructosivorans]
MNNDLTVIKLDRERTLKFRRKELKLLEKTFGKKISKIEFEDMGIDDVTKMIHLGLLYEDSELTLEKAEELVDNSAMTFGEMMMAVMEAFKISMSGPNENNNKDAVNETKN